MAVSVDLVGRDDQLAQLRDSLDAASAGEGRVLFLTGEAGIGKSRLARVIASDAARGALPVLRGRATETATPAPYRPLAEALSSAVRAGVAPDASQLGPFRSILGRLVPEWSGEDHQRLEEPQVAVAEGVLRFLRATAGDSGVLVVLEDLHGADPETVTIVEYLADNLAYERVLCVVTVRDDQSSAVKDLLRSLSVRGVAGIIELAPLDLQHVAAMVTSCLAPGEVPDEVVAFAARAGGVPFLVEELLAAALSSGALVKEAGSWRVVKPLDAVVPVSFSQSMRRRIRELGAHGEEVLAVAATLGRRFDWSLMRKTGATVPRRRTDRGVPGELQALGVTAREFEVLRLLALGLPNKDIGARLYLSPRTVERHIANLAVKTGAARRSQLVAYAARTVTGRTS